LFFLDYLALGRDNPDKVAALVEGVSAGCLQAGAALLGGETAIMPDVYHGEEFDMAGFCVGVVERENIIDGSKITPGDVVIGLASSGFHSNGYSLIRKVLFDQLRMKIDDRIEALNATLADVLLEPTRIYAKSINKLLQNESLARAVHGMAHITGGGLVENIERILPEKCQLEINKDYWPQLPVFEWFASLGQVSIQEMARVFNMSLGYALITAPDRVDELIQTLAENGEATYPVGLIETK
jgi:phosphoribosylformylglycinamidine cyclo-ligase